MTQAVNAVDYADMAALGVTFSQHADQMVARGNAVGGARDAAAVSYVSNASTQFQGAVDTWLQALGRIVVELRTMSEELGSANATYQDTQANNEAAANALAQQMSDVQGALG